MRYTKQIQVPAFGEAGQQSLSAARVAIVGCGALGCLQAELLTRMGVGALRIADGDIVSLDNLHRQTLFTERDAAEGTPKVAAAQARLAALNREVQLSVVAERVTRDNIGRFASEATLILDATDSTPTRYLINDFCVRNRVPWIYTGVAGTGGMVLPVLPMEGPCLRCLYPDPPEESDTATCATSGILPTAVTQAVSLQITQALRILTRTAAPGTLVRFDAWDASVRTSLVRRDPGCPCCGARRFEFLAPETPAAPPLATSVCSQQMVRVESAFWGEDAFDMQQALRAAEVRGAAAEQKGLLWIVTREGRRVSLFPDGHLLVHACTVPDEALAFARELFGLA